MKRPKLKYPWVRVRWKDITGLSSWGPPSEIHPAVAYQEGWLIWEDDESIVVSNCVCGDDFANRDCIAKGMILELEYVGSKPKPEPEKEAKRDN